MTDAAPKLKLKPQALAFSPSSSRFFLTQGEGSRFEVFFGFGCFGWLPYFSANSVIASSIKSFAVRSVSVTRCRSVFHFSGIARSSFYYRPRPESAEELELLKRLDRIFTEATSSTSSKIRSRSRPTIAQHSSAKRYTCAGN
jgi:hypothetical protein